MSAFKKFRVHLPNEERPGNGMSMSYVHARLDLANERMLKQFDEWRATERPTILAINFGRYATTEISGDFFVWMDVLYE